jgi:hypothetical protein
MTTITVRADDAAHALAEAMRRLGPDALVLTTRQIGGRVEITAAAPDPDPAPPPPAPPAAAASGFSAQLLRRLAAAPVAQGVLPPQLPPRILLVGPPGGGRSLLAARLAAAALRAEGAARPRLIAPRTELLSPPGRLAGWARIMGLVPDRPLWRPGQPCTLPPPHPDESQIVDLSDLPDPAPEAVLPHLALPGAALWLVLPAGLHPVQHDRLHDRLFGLLSCIVLTRTDLCPPTPEDLALPARFGLPVALHAQGSGLIDALKPVLRGAPPSAPAPAAAALPEPADAAARLS